MIHAIVHVLIIAVAVLISAKIVPGLRVKSFSGAVGFAIVLAILNKLLFGLLMFLTFPLVFLTLGLFVFVINALLFWMADKLVGSVQVDGFGAALFGSALTSLFTMIGGRLFL